MYSCKQVEQLIDHYIEKGGHVETIMEGCLCYGTTILSGPGLKYAVVTEVYLSAWSSAHKIRLYNELPKKYELLLNELN